MILGRLQINSQTWTEIASGSTWVQFSAKGSQGTMVTFTEAEDADDSFEGCVRFGSFPNGFDFDQKGYPEGQKIWAKSIAAQDELCIVRETNFYFGLIPSGADSLITADGDTFKVLGNG